MINNHFGNQIESKKIQKPVLSGCDNLDIDGVEW